MSTYTLSDDELRALAERYTLQIAKDEDNDYLVLCPSFPGLSAFGDTREAALEEGLVALTGFIAEFQAQGWDLPEPTRTPASYSGQLRLRMPKSLHAHLAQEAEEEGVSLNMHIVSKLSRV